MSYCGKKNNFEELWNFVMFGYFWGVGVVSDLKRVWLCDISLFRVLLILNN